MDKPVISRALVEKPELLCRLTLPSDEGWWHYNTERNPDNKCKKTGCFGRGYVGRQQVSKQPIPCKCVGRWDLTSEPHGGGSEDGPPGRS